MTFVFHNTGSGRLKITSSGCFKQIADSLRIPRPTEPRQTDLAGEELLHGSLLDGLLLCDQCL